MSDIRDPEDFMERPCVKSITSCSKRLTRLQHHVKYANAGSMLIMFAKRNTCAHLFALDWIWYSSTGRTQTLYKLTSVSTWTCDFHICFSSSVTQFINEFRTRCCPCGLYRLLRKWIRWPLQLGWAQHGLPVELGLCLQYAGFCSLLALIGLMNFIYVVCKRSKPLSYIF